MKKYRKQARLLLALVFVGSIGMMLWQMLQYSASEQSSSQAQMIAFGDTHPETVAMELYEFPEETLPMAPMPTPVIPMDEGAKFLTEVNIWALRQINPEVLGWLYIPDTVISYPLMQTDNNDTYLHQSWDHKSSKNGSIFLEHRNSSDMTDFNTVVYGHHMANGSMFGTLKYFRKQEYVQSHPYIYLCTADEIFRYQIFAVYDAPIDSDTYRMYFVNEEAKQQALTHFLASNTLETDLTPTVEDSFLTLSTCTGTGIYTSRIVVQAVLTGQWKK